MRLNHGFADLCNYSRNDELKIASKSIRIVTRRFVERGKEEYK